MGSHLAAHIISRAVSPTPTNISSPSPHHWGQWQTSDTRVAAPLHWRDHLLPRRSVPAESVPGDRGCPYWALAGICRVATAMVGLCITVSGGRKQGSSSEVMAEAGRLFLP